jgi:hypothetical protein
MKPKVLMIVLTAIVSLAAAACGAGAAATSGPSAGEGSGAAPTSAPAQPAGGQPVAPSGVDPLVVDLCALLPRAELAALASGTPYDGNDPAGQACIYTIDPGDGTAELYSMSVSPPELIQPMVDYVRQYEQAEWLEGIGDTAYLQPADFGEGFDIVVLVEGEYGLSLGGPRPEVLQAAARLIVERMGE